MKESEGSERREGREKQEKGRGGEGGGKDEETSIEGCCSILYRFDNGDAPSGDEARDDSRMAH